MTEKNTRVGIEVGGTFTDIVAITNGRMRVAKVPSTPASPDVGAINALSKLGIAPASVSELVHGSTVATNAVLERKGARIAMLVTKGTRDVLSLQRHDRKSIYKLQYRKPEPIVARDNIFEVSGRIAADGEIVEPVDEQNDRDLIEKIVRSSDYDVIVICLLNSYVNVAHEILIKDIVRTIDPSFAVICSHEVSREFREYERASTTALAGFVQPVIKGYLNRFAASLAEDGFDGALSVMQSNGGRMPAAAVGDQPITALLSGPAAGVVGAVKAAESMGLRDLITLDMGGTSTDVAMIQNSRPELTAELEIDGLPIRTPVVDIVTVGAGGGSIAWIDDGAMLRVGPRSAGAVPGPASYGRGGTEPTVTDANLVRGSLRAGSLRDQGIDVDEEAALASFAPLSDALSLSNEDMADAVIRVAESNIVRAIQKISTERGNDPRRFTLVAFGGAAAVHAARVAEELNIRNVLVPMNAGVVSAAGLLSSDYVHYTVATQRYRLAVENLATIRGVIDGLKEKARDHLVNEGVSGAPNFEVFLEMRYVGQAFEIPVALNDIDDALTVEAIGRAFAAEHHRIFEFSKPADALAEIVSFRVGARIPAQVVRPMIDRGDDPGPPEQEIELREKGQTLKCRVVRSDHLGAEAESGPLLIEDGTTTILVPSNWTARRDASQHVVLEGGDQ
ncbi:hydantoinase/oxoprolinase family protein [Roseovarius spongiae]|uniref:Hydantoinase/oxoprolinase family protein n=1 Tax=Roseovarius spongiae TaxID=2320272 RepID=A0A3A8B7K3_9RHOB|nr:hydantoinase/oxoprolinase family protein [Roseovarius spongiae]RKF12671.1 hydantoinase/oxoprolinase family protein [Roseovarius spongiae]